MADTPWGAKPQNSKGFYYRDVTSAKHLSIGMFPPRLRFNGFVEFTINPDLGMIGLIENKLAGFTQTFTLPKIQFKNEVRNQYNIKRIATTGVDLTPVTITMYDTVTNDWYELLMTYYSYMFMNPRQASKVDTIGGTKGIPNNSNTWTRSSTFMTDSFPSNSSGLDANDTVHLFDSCRMVVVNGGQGRSITLHRPTINQMNFGEVDYSSNDPNTFDLELEYENFVLDGPVEDVLDDIDLQKFDIVGDGYPSRTIFDKYHERSKNDPFHVANQGGIATNTLGELSEADRRSQPQVQPPKEKKPQSEKKGPRDKIGMEIPGP